MKNSTLQKCDSVLPNQANQLGWKEPKLVARSLPTTKLTSKLPAIISFAILYYFNVKLGWKATKPNFFRTDSSYFCIISEAKKPGQIAVVYHYCDLSRFFLTQTLFYRGAELIIALIALLKLLFYQTMRGFESQKYSNSNP